MQIADDLRARILDGRLAPGDNVPTEADLATEWQTSRGPVRNALGALRAEGLIDTGRGRPARVVRRKPSQAVDAEIPFTRWAEAIGAVPGAVTQQVSLRRADAGVAAAFEIDEGDQVVEVLRLRFLDGRRTMFERLAYRKDVGRVLFEHDLDSLSITELLAENGFPRVDVLHEIDAIAADELDSEMLGIPLGAPILRLHRVARDADGRVTEVSDDHYRSEIVRFTASAAGVPATDRGTYVRDVQHL
nr:GntR family transcriptional regulator [Leucobacter edaphi]